jgi:uncharacterized membrane protein YfcA
MIDALNKGRPTAHVIVRVAAGAATAIIFGSGLAHAHSNDWAAPFMGGIMAGRVLSHIQEQRERQTQAMEMARGGGAYQGYGGYSGGYGGGFAGYGGGYGRPAYEPPPQYGAPPGCR